MSENIMRSFSIYMLNKIEKLIRSMIVAISICNEKKEESLGFVDLAPVDCADLDGTYTAALKFAAENRKIKNFALTGPYGSGKSSVIKTFERSTSYKFLNISLAAFENPKNESGNSCSIDEAQNQAIERSILQQMIYGVSPKKLPYSRFKRICPPSFLEIKSVAFVVVSLMGINEYLNGTLSGFVSNKEFSNPWLYFSVAFLSVILGLIFYSFGKAKHSYSIKKLSLQNGEIEVGDLSVDSILNRHLDEIIYFFEATGYDIVVIEDLDRFGSTEIFIKLREINKLINDRETNAVGGLKPIKFLYAIKDDMFINKDRSKFFDFIIPVIPIINSSNSYEKITERLKNYDFYRKIDVQFLKEMSLYIDDLRLIHNIINEFIVYEKKLTSESINNSKLLSMIVYKNVYPNDFELLHHSQGVFFSILKKKSNIINSGIIEIRKNIRNLEDEIEVSKKESLVSVEELIKIFLFHLCNGRRVNGVYIDDALVDFEKIVVWDNFSKLFKSNDICVSEYSRNYHGSWSWSKVNLGKSFSDVEKEVLRNTTFKERKDGIDGKANDNFIALSSKLSKLKKEIVEIYSLSFCELIEKFNVDIVSLVNGNGIKDSSLLVFLIKNGYLDGSYHTYISNFHEGRLSKNDRDYLLSIRDFKAPNPLLRIDTPDEVCGDMREDDFGNEYVLNVNLVDYLLTTTNCKHQKISSAIDFISSNFDRSKDFFDAYWSEGENLESLVKAMASQWPLCAYEAICEGYPIEHVASILAYVDADYLSRKMNGDNMLSEYVSENIAEIFSCDLVVIDNFDFLKHLDVKIKNIDGIKSQDRLLEFIHKNNCYQISFDNISIVLKKYKKSSGEVIFDEERANYSTVREYGSQELNQYIAEELSKYVNDIIIASENNSKESGKYIFDLINSGNLSLDQKESIVNGQDFVFQNFNSVPDVLWEIILLSEKLVFNWKNIFDCFSSEECSNDSITKILNRKNIVEFLHREKIGKDDLGEDGALKLSKFILNNELISNGNYSDLCGCFSFHYNNFPENLSKEKLISLAKQRVVRLNNNSFNFSASDDRLLVLLISKNIDEYIKNESSYPIGDAAREMLIFSDISDMHKRGFAKKLSFGSVKESDRLVAYISDLIFESNLSPSDFSEEIIFFCVANTKPINKAIGVLSKSISFLARDTVMFILESMPEPYRDIASNGKRPKLKKTEGNIELVAKLKSANIIASFNEEGDHLRVNTFRGSKEG